MKSNRPIHVSPTSPTIVRRTVVPASPVVSTVPVAPRVETTVQEVPIIRKTVVRPRVHHQIVHEPEITTTEHIVHQPVVQAVAVPAVPTVPPSRPVPSFPRTHIHKHTAKRTTTTVTTRGGVPGQTKTRILTAEQHRNLQLEPGEKVLRVEKLPTVRTVTSTKVVATPPVVEDTSRHIAVKAVADYIPRTIGEVGLVAGETVIYMGSEGSWSYIRKTNGTSGFVPHSYLSL